MTGVIFCRPAAPISEKQVNTEVDSALDTAIPGSPTAGSVNERVKTLDDDWNDGGRLDNILDGIDSKTTNLPSDPADASVVAGNITTAHSTTDGLITTVDTEVDKIAAGHYQLGPYNLTCSPTPITIDNTEGDQVIVAANTQALKPLPDYIDNTKIVSVQVVVMMVEVSSYDGVNNWVKGNWEMSMGAGGFTAVSSNGGNFSSGDLPINVQYGALAHRFVLDATAVITDADGNIGLQIADADMAQNNMVCTFTVDVYFTMSHT